MSYKTALIAFDGSSDSILALETAAQVHGTSTMRLHLVHCADPVPALLGGTVREDAYKEQLKEAAVIFDKARAALEKWDIPFQTHIRRGDPGMEIINMAVELRCDVIFMGTRGHGSLTSLILGSVSQTVLNHARVPVILANNASGK